MQRTKIPWCEYTWNPAYGCSLPVVSEGCRFCYARKLHTSRHKAYKAGKTGLPKQYAKPFHEIQLFPDRLNDPLKKRDPATIFVGSMTDLFGPKVPFEFIDKAFDKMKEAKRHDYYILTKRTKRMAKYIQRLITILERERHREKYIAMDCFHFGVTICTQAEMDEKGPIHRSIPAAHRFWSLEPLLGPIEDINFKGIGQVIVGGESGPKARPMHPAWVRSIRNQCIAANIPFFFKQWGEFVAPNQTTYSGNHDGWRFPVGCSYMKYDGTYYPGYPSGGPSAWTKIYRIGKKKAGCILDGREWKQGFTKPPSAAKKS